MSAAVNESSLAVGDRIRAFVREHPVVVAVVALTILGLFARFASLGWRVAHWDEARVAYWVDHALETGHFAYNSHTHGPFIQHVDRYLFSVLGANDFTARLPVAVIGGLLPLSALLYRAHLRDVETVIMAGFLTASPVLVYYSRFMRSDVLVATFMFVAFGFLVRFYDTRRMRYLYGATVMLVFGIASKENAPLYVLTWLGAGTVAIDAALYRPREYRRGVDLVLGKFGHVRDWLFADDRPLSQRGKWYLGHGLGLAIVFVALFVFMFAPRGGGMAGMQYPQGEVDATLGLWEALANPLSIPTLVVDTFSYVVYPEGEYFAFGGIDGVVLDLPGPPDVSGTDNTVPYLSRLGGMVRGLVTMALPVLGFAIVGFLRERYAAEHSRTLVLFMTYAGVASIVGYPLVFSIETGWKWGMTHVVVPLSIPAAVGLGIVGRSLLDALATDDRMDAVIGALVLAAVVVLVVSTAVPATYGSNNRSGNNPLVQYGQPGDDMRPALERIQHIAPDHAGTDVVVYDGTVIDSGSFLREDSESASKDFRPVCTEWTNTLPINWYLAAYDADTACVNESHALKNVTGEDPVPVVITRNSDPSVPGEVLRENFHPLTYQLRTDGSEATFYIHEDYWYPNR